MVNVTAMRNGLVNRHRKCLVALYVDQSKRSPDHEVGRPCFRDSELLRGHLVNRHDRLRVLWSVL